MTKAEWHGPALPFKAQPVIPFSFILALFLLLSWVTAYFIWEHCTFFSPKPPVTNTHLPLKTDSPAWETATMTMQNEQPFDLNTAFTQQECILLYAQLSQQQAPLSFIQLCQKSVTP